ncbi:MAG: 5-formyltetrahydrofolate cyclo-ligase [Candidatus Peregrinibacteria bacterium]
MTHPSVEKATLRKAILERLQKIPDHMKAAESRSITRRIVESLPQDIAICGFVPLKTEPNIRPALEEILQRNQPLYLPVFDGKALTFRKTTDLETLIMGPHGIPEPPKSAPILPENLPLFVLVPGRAFDAHGGRLGRGNGGYDRWITEHRKSGVESKCVGVAFDHQIVPEVPMEEHDQYVDAVITGRGSLASDKQEVIS